MSVKAIPSGTTVVFRMNTPPVGWVKDTSSFNDHMLRVVIGDVSSGGSINFSDLYTSNASYSITFTANSEAVSIGASTLSISQIPPHRHGHSRVGFSYVTALGFPTTRTGFGNYFADTPTGFTGGGVAHTHPAGNAFSSVTASSETSLDFNVKYVDVIRATRE